jgi:hypothetical protein
MGTCLLSMRRPSLALWFGILVAAALMAAETLVVDPLAGDEHRATRP